MKKNRRYHKGVAYSWLISYISILLIPLLITGVLFIGIERIVNNKISSMNRSILSQIRGTLDNIFDSVYKSSLQIELSAELNAVLYLDEEMDGNSAYSQYRLSEYIRQYTIYNDYIDDVIVYLNQSGYSITSKSSYEPALFQEMLHQYGFSEEDWQFLCGKEKRGFYILEQESGNSGRAIYVAPLPAATTAQKAGELVIIPKEKYFNQKVNIDSFSAEKAIYLICMDKVMALGDVPSWMNTDFAAIWKDREHWEEKTGGKKIIYSALNSKFTDFEYIIVDQYQAVYSELQIIRMIVMISIAASMIVGIGFAIYMTKKNYVPMRELVSSVMRSVDMKKDHDDNEYILLSNAILSVINNRQEAEMQLSLIKLLRGYHVSERITDQWYQTDQVVAVVFAIEDTKEFFKGEDLLSDRNRLLAFVVSNCVKDFFGNSTKLFELVELDRYLVQIIGYEGREEQRIDILKSLEELHEFFNKKLKIKLSISLSECCCRLEEINTIYEKAREALEYRLVMGNNVVIDSHDLGDFALSYDYSIENEKDIINSLKNGNYEQSKELMFQVIDNNLSAGMMSSQLARCMLFDLVGTVVKALSLTKLDSNFLGQLNPIDRLFQCETFEQMKEELADILYQVCSYTNQDKENPNRKLFERIEEFVEHHYMDPELNVTSLAADLYVSKTFLVKLFKEYTGLTPLDYINRLRCERAVAMLGKSEYTIEVISSKVGYSSAHSFIRVFKKLYGKTPGAYRIMLLGEEEN